MLKLIFFSFAFCCSLQAWSQAELDDIICFPDYGREVKESGAKTIKVLLRSSNDVALRAVVSLDDQFRPKKIVFAKDLFAKDTSDIIHIDYSHLDQGFIFRVDSIFRNSPNFHTNIYDENGDAVRTRNTDSKGGAVVKKIYTLDSFSVKVTTIYVYDQDTLYDQDAHILMYFPDVTIDDFGKSTIKYDVKLNGFAYESIANEITTKGLDGAVLQKMTLENGLVKSIHNYGFIPSSIDFKYDNFRRVISMEIRDASDYVVESRQYLYNKREKRISNIKIATPEAKSEICYQYPRGGADQVAKIVKYYSIDSEKGRVLEMMKHYTAKGFLVKDGRYESTTNNRLQWVVDEYRLEK